MDLQERVERLERANRRWTRVGLAALFAAAIGVSLGFVQNADDLEARETQLRSQQIYLRRHILQETKLEQDVKPMMAKLIENARNGDIESTKTILGIIFADGE
jgi:hypothetical protein